MDCGRGGLPGTAQVQTSWSERHLIPGSSYLFFKPEWLALLIFRAR